MMTTRHPTPPIGRSPVAGVVSALVAVAVLAASAVPALAQPSGPISVPPPGPAASEQIPLLREVGIEQKLDARIPLGLEFVDADGRTVELSEFFGDRPVILALVYYECPMLCTLVLNGLVGALGALEFTAGTDFEVVVVSIDPGETPALAADKRETYGGRYRRSDTGLHFLTGRAASIDRLTDAVGFRYAYDEATDQWAHPAAITILTPDGRVSRYLFGIEFAPRDMRFALIDATDGAIGTVVDQALLFCFHYDPSTGKYGLVVMNLVRLGGVITLLGMGAFIVVALRRERRGRSSHNE